MPTPDYSTEIAALTQAIASGALEVRYTDYTVKYDSLENLLARLRWLERQQGTGGGSIKAVFGSFSRGE